MPRLQYLADIPIDIPHTLGQLLNKFGAIKHGLPELLKNSKDQYARLRVTEREKRQILVLVNSEACRLGVVDFAGASTTDFSAWQIWSDRQANRRELADDIEGGNGNGGKGFMCKGSTTVSTIESCTNGRYTQMAFNTKDEAHQFHPAYAIGDDGKPLRNITVESPRDRLNEALVPFPAR